MHFSDLVDRFNLTSRADANTRAGNIGYKPVVGWALNDSMTSEGISAQLASFDRCGYGGVLVIPWGGLPYDFMSDQWLDMVECILVSAEKRKLEVWIWEDWIFPSGFGGGHVSNDVAYRAKKLKITSDVTLENGEQFDSVLPPRVLAAGVFGIDKFENPVTDVTNLDATPGTALKYRSVGRNRLVVVSWDYASGQQHTVKSHGIYLTGDPASNIYTCNDLEAFSVDMLNRDATLKYLDLIHERYWEKLQGHFGKTLKGFFYDEPHIPSQLPWSQGLAADFMARKGYDIKDRLVSLLVEHKMYDHTYDNMQPETTKALRADYCDVWTSMISENFYGTIQEWCRSHGVLSIGHQVSDESLSRVISGSGMSFKNMDRSDMPGIDVVFDNLKFGKFTDFTRMAGSRARIRGMKWAMSESFAAMGHGVYPDEMRYVEEHQIIRGINKFFTKLANYNPQKSFYFHPPELSEANPMIKHYGRLVNDRVEKLCTLMSAGPSVDRLLVYVPKQNFLWKDETIAGTIDELTRKLVQHQKEYDYSWDGDLLSMDVKAGGLVSSSGQAYNCIVLPGGTMVTDTSLLAKLASFAEEGPRVVVCEPSVGELTGIGEHVSDLEELILLFGSGNDLLETEDGGSMVSVSSSALGDGSCVFLFLNETLEPASLVIRAKGDARMAEIDLSCWDIYDMGDGPTCNLHFQPGESKMILLDSTGTISYPSKPEVDLRESVSLDSWKLRLPDDQMLNLKGDLPTWNKLGFGDYSGFMRYSTEFEWHGEGEQALLSLGAVRHASTIYVDGKLAGHCLFTPFTLMLDNLTHGSHVLEIDVLNTVANSVCGTKERLAEIEKSGRLEGTYAPLYIPNDKKRLKSGLLGPVRLCPMREKNTLSGRLIDSTVVAKYTVPAS